MSLDRILTLHEQGKDYRAIFDYHDDFVVLDSSVNPSSAFTYQVKGKGSGSWTTANLTAGSKSEKKPGSILGKMYASVDVFDQALQTSSLLTNCSFSFRLSDDPKDHSKTTPSHVLISCDEIAQFERKKMSECLDDDFGSARNIDHESIFRFEITNVPIVGAEHYLRGRLATYFESMGQSVPARALHDTLISEVVDKSCNADVCKTEDEIYKKKSLCRADMDRLFEAAIARQRTILDDWDVLKSELVKAGWRLADIIRLQTACISYHQLRARGDASAKRFQACCTAIGAARADEIAACVDIAEVAEILMADVSMSDFAGFGTQGVKGAAYFEAYEALHA